MPAFTLNSLLFFGLGIASSAVAQFNVTQGLQNPESRHYLGGEVVTSGGYNLRIGGQLMGSNSYTSGQYQAWLNTFTKCRIYGQNTAPAVCASNLIARAIADAVTSVDNDPNFDNPANMRTVAGPTDAAAERWYILWDGGQGRSCDDKPWPQATCSRDLQGPGNWLNGAMDYTWDTSSSSSRKIKVTCKKACDVGPIPDAPMDKLIQENLVPSLQQNFAMGAMFAFSRSDNSRVFARCRLTIAGEEWYDQVSGCPDYIENSAPTLTQC